MRLTRSSLPLAVAALVLSGLAPVHADGDPALRGRVFQSSDGALWVYKDGVKYPLLGLDLSDEQIDAIPMASPAIEDLDALFVGPAPPAPAPPPPPPPPAPPILRVANPQPSDTIPTVLDMQGTAVDPLAAGGSGVDRVQVSLEDRDQGGQPLGDATLGRTVVNGWEVVVNLPAGAHTLFVYARSAVTGREAVVSIPVQVGP